MSSVLAARGKLGMGVGTQRGGAALTYQQRVLATASANLIAYWPLNEAAGATADNAEGTAARDGAYIGVTLGQPGVGDGNTCPLFVPASLGECRTTSASLSAAINLDEGTLAVWVKVRNVSVWTDGLLESAMHYARSGSDNIVAIQKVHPSTLKWTRIGPAGNNKSVSLAAQSSIGWMHLALTWSVSADALKAYLNGVQQGATVTGLLAKNSAPVCGSVGSIKPLATQYWDGYLAHPAIWTTPLTEPQIAALATV